MTKPDDFDTIMERCEYHMADIEQCVAELQAWMAAYCERAVTRETPAVQN